MKVYTVLVRTSNFQRVQSAMPKRVVKREGDHLTVELRSSAEAAAAHDLILALGYQGEVGYVEDGRFTRIAPSTFKSLTELGVLR